MTYANVTGHTWEGVSFSMGAWFRRRGGGRCVEPTGTPSFIGTWNQPNSLDGFVDSQSAVYDCTPGQPNCNLDAGVSAMPLLGHGRNGTAHATPRSPGAPPIGAGEPRGNVRVSGGGSLAFVGCNFSAIGAPYALSIMEAAQVLRGVF